MTRHAMLIALLALASCEPGAVVARDADERAEVELLDVPEDEAREGDKRLYRASGITVAFQRIERRQIPNEPTLAEVAAALVERYEAGEVDGELAQRPCTFGRGRARCIEGHVIHDGRRFERRGALLEDGRHVLLVEVLGEERDHDRVERQYDLAKETFRWLDG